LGIPAGLAWNAGVFRALFPALMGTTSDVPFVGLFEPCPAACIRSWHVLLNFSLKATQQAVLKMT